MSLITTNPFAGKATDWPWIMRDWATDNGSDAVFAGGGDGAGTPYFLVSDSAFAELAAICWRPALGQAGLTAAFTGGQFFWYDNVRSPGDPDYEDGTVPTSLTFSVDAASGDFDDSEAFADFTRDGNTPIVVEISSASPLLSDESWDVTVDTIEHGDVTFTFRGTLYGVFTFYFAPWTRGGEMVCAAEAKVTLGYACTATSDVAVDPSYWGTGEGQCEHGAEMSGTWGNNCNEPHFRDAPNDVERIDWESLGTAKASCTEQGAAYIDLRTSSSTTPAATLAAGPMYYVAAAGADATLTAVRLILNKLHAAPA